jgi:hypothetical protein
MDIISIPEIEAILIFTSWEMHIPIAVEAMKAGKYVGVEVGGSYSIQDCYELVRVSEQNQIPCMMLENCCYGRREMMALNMERKGILGDIIHCTGGYSHDLREEIASGKVNRHYRLMNYLNRNCDNYPTHALGPIAKILRINRGNNFLSVASFASCSKGLSKYFNDHADRFSEYKDCSPAQADVVTTIITCAGGQTICLTLDTTLPGYYSRHFGIFGTKGRYIEENDSVFLDGEHNPDNELWKPQWGNAAVLEDRFDHPLWESYKNDVKQGHGGMDWLVIRAFVESVKNREQTPIDVYDTAAWMSISALSESSIALGGTPVPAHDFTHGNWVKNNNDPLRNKYTLD